jgi:hypothetical protein
LIRRIASCALAAALLLGGCGATTVPESSVATSSSVTLSPAPSLVAPSLAPTPTPDPEALRKAAASAYLAAASKANKANKANNALRKKYRHDATLAGARAFYKGEAAIEGSFIKAVRAIIWPPDTAGDAHTLIVRETALQALDLEGARVRTWADVGSVEKALTGAERAATAAANLVRSDLGLPPVQF